MDADSILRHIRETLDGLDILDTPECTYVYYDPRHDLPHDRRQPFATLLRTDAYDHASDLERRGLFRLNLGVKRETYRAMLGPEPAWGPGGGVVETDHDLTRVDAWMPHPIYAPMGWISIVAPSDASWPRAKELLAEAHAEAKRAYDRHRRA